MIGLYISVHAHALGLTFPIQAILFGRFSCDRSGRESLVLGFDPILPMDLQFLPSYHKWEALDSSLNICQGLRMRYRDQTPEPRRPVECALRRHARPWWLHIYLDDSAGPLTFPGVMRRASWL